MHDPLLMRVFQPERRLPRDLASIRDRQRTARFRDAVQIESLDIFHHQEVRPIHFARIGRLHDCRMTELPDDAHLALKPRDRLLITKTSGGQQLHRDQSIQSSMHCFVNRPHAARTDCFQQPIISEHGRLIRSRISILVTDGVETDTVNHTGRSHARLRCGVPRNVDRLHLRQRLFQYNVRLFFCRWLGISNDSSDWKTKAVSQRVTGPIQLRDRRLTTQTGFEVSGDHIALFVGQFSK